MQKNGAKKEGNNNYVKFSINISDEKLNAILERSKLRAQNSAEETGM